MGFALVVFLPDAVCDLRAGAADLHADHVVEDQRGDFGGNQSVVGVSSDALQLQGAVVVEPVPAIFLELVAGRHLRGDDHHADQRPGRVRLVADAVLGFGDTRHGRVPDLPHSGYAAVPAALQDVRAAGTVDGN